jgi:hypothetical protein
MAACHSSRRNAPHAASNSRHLTKSLQVAVPNKKQAHACSQACRYHKELPVYTRLRKWLPAATYVPCHHHGHCTPACKCAMPRLFIQSCFILSWNQ